jgi:hypothetical protein
LSFPASADGVIAMRVDTAGLDPRWDSVTVVFNATPSPIAQAVDGQGFALHPVQADSQDPVVRQAAFDPATGTLTVPARTVAVFTTSPEKR